MTTTKSLFDSSQQQMFSTDQASFMNQPMNDQSSRLQVNQGHQQLPLRSLTAAQNQSTDKNKLLLQFLAQKLGQGHDSSNQSGMAHHPGQGQDGGQSRGDQLTQERIRALVHLLKQRQQQQQGQRLNSPAATATTGRTSQFVTPNHTPTHSQPPTPVHFMSPDVGATSGVVVDPAQQLTSQPGLISIAESSAAAAAVTSRDPLLCFADDGL